MSRKLRVARTAPAPPRTMPRAALLAALCCTTLVGFLPAARSDRSSSERSPAPLDAAELLRDAPLYPPLRDNYPDAENLAETYNEQHNDKATSNLRPDFANFQPFFDTNESDEDSVENTDVNEVTGVNYDDPETSIEDSSIPVTPEQNDVEDTVSYDNKIGDKINDESLFERDLVSQSNVTPENNDDQLNVPQVSEFTEKDQSDKFVFNETGKQLEKEEFGQSNNGFIVAPATDVDDLISILEDNESQGFTSDESLREAIADIIGKPSVVEDDSSDGYVTEESSDRKKRNTPDWDKPTKARRVKTGDTILNIRGAVRDAIGDAGAAPGPRASSRVDAFVIRPSPALRDEPRDRAREARMDRLAATPPQPLKSEKELVVEPQSPARLVCDLLNVTSLRWYKDSEQVNLPSSPGGGESAWREGDAVEIPRASRGHAARWRCAGLDRSGRTVTGEPTRLLIYEPVRSVYLAVDGRRLDAGNTWVPVRDKTVLEVRCVAEGGVPPPELSWRLLALEPALDHRPYLRIHHTNYSVEGVSWSRAVVTAARELHNGTLQCAARQRRPVPSAPSAALAAKLEIHVTYPPSFVISRWPGFGVALAAGGAAALRCDVDANPPAHATWMRDSDRPSSSPTPLETGAEDGNSLGAATLRWARLREAHGGWYRCRARWMDTEYSSIGYYLNVLASDEGGPSATESGPEDVEPDHQKVEVPLGGNVQLHCPKGSVGCWWRRVVGNASDAWAPAGSHHAHGVLGIKEALYEEGGEYRCVGARGADLKRLRELKRVTLRVTGGATATALGVEPTPTGWRLECGACGRSVRVLWLRGGTVTPAILTPDLAQHCWKAVIQIPEPDEVWCLAVSAGGGAVAVFPRRSLQSSPGPARHAVRALQAGADLPTTRLLPWTIPIFCTFVFV